MVASTPKPASKWPRWVGLILFTVSGVAFATTFDPGKPLPIWLGFTIAVLAFLGGMFAGFGEDGGGKAELRVAEAEAKLQREPEKAAPAWTVAQARMEQYFGRNLAQVKLIFFVSLVVMLVGFGFVLYGIRLGLANPAALQVSYLASAAGIISEFIGVTFLMLYRSTLTEANSFMSVLERINTVGMAVQILDTIPDADKELKNKCRAELVHLLVSADRKQSADVKSKAAPSSE